MIIKMIDNCLVKASTISRGGFVLTYLNGRDQLVMRVDDQPGVDEGKLRFVYMGGGTFCVLEPEMYVLPVSIEVGINHYKKG